MRTLHFLFCLLLVTTVLGQKGPVKENTDLAPFQKVVDEINASLANANSYLAERNIRLGSADVTFKTTHTTTGTAGLKIVVKAKHTREFENTSTTTLKFESADSLLKVDKGAALREKLAKAIVEASDAWSKTSNINGLRKDAVTVELAFSMAHTSEGGIEFDVWGAGAELGAKYKKAAIHTIKLTFKPAAPPVISSR